MPIKLLALQRRFAEQGRIRLGYKQGGNGRPVKLEMFRFTSPSEQHIKDLAALYGGEPKPWDNSGKPEFEVYSEVKSIPVIAVKGGLSQWLETWSGGGCVHRCDGETNVLTNEPCDPEDPKHVNAKPTTRLSMMLPELESIGVWRMESHGWNAAAEIPAVAELAQFVGDLVPASLDLVERRSVKEGKTSRFVVPVLDLKIATHRLRELVEAKVNGQTELQAPTERPALQAAAGASAETDAFAPFFERLAGCSTVEQAQALWGEMVEARLVGSQATPSPRAAEFLEAFKAKGATLTASPPAAAGAVPDADGVVDAELVDEDADSVWQRALVVAGQRGMALDAVVEDFKVRMGGVIPDEATAGELEQYLGLLEAEVPAA